MTIDELINSEYFLYERLAKLERRAKKGNLVILQDVAMIKKTKLRLVEIEKEIELFLSEGPAA